MDSNQVAETFLVLLPFLMFSGAAWCFYRAFLHFQHAERLAYEATRLMVEARTALPRDHRGRFLPRRHLGEDSIGSGDFFDA